MYTRKRKMCEEMASVVCDTSMLKFTDYELKGQTFNHNICNRCDVGIIESIHLVVQCIFYSNERHMYEQLNELENESVKRVLDDTQIISYSTHLWGSSLSLRLSNQWLKDGWVQAAISVKCTHVLPSSDVNRWI